MGGTILFFNRSILLVYSADVDTRPEDGGGVWFRNVTSPETMERALTEPTLMSLVLTVVS